MFFQPRHSSHPASAKPPAPEGQHCPAASSRLPINQADTKPQSSRNSLLPRSLPLWASPLAWSTASLAALAIFFSPASLARECDDIDDLGPECTSLELNFTGLTSLPEGIFRGPTNVEEINLNFNHLTSLPEGIFRGLTNLERIYLISNALTSLPEGIFRGLTNLEVIYLGSNYLPSLPEGIFRGLTNLEEIDLSSNYLSSLPEGIFRGLTNLEEIDLSSNYPSSLPEGIFRGLTNLTEIYLASNDLTSLPEGLFRGLTNLEYINLLHNNLSCLPSIPLSVRVNPSSLRNLPSCGENRPPELSSRRFQARDLGVGVRFRFNASPYFTDPDGDPLTYSASSSDTSKLAINEPSDGTFVITGKQEGDVRVTVTADDGNGGTREASFTVRVQNNRIVIDRDEVRVRLNPFDSIQAAEVYKLYKNIDGLIKRNTQIKEVKSSENKKEFVINSKDLINTVLGSGDVVRYLTGPFNDFINGWSGEYNISLGRRLEEGEEVWVRLRSSHPDLFVIQPGDRVVFTHGDDDPKTVTIRMNFSLQDYVLRELDDFPDEVTLSHNSNLPGDIDDLTIVLDKPTGTLRKRMFNQFAELHRAILENRLEALCATQMHCRLLWGSFETGQLIGELLLLIPGVDEALDDLAGALGTAYGTLRAKYLLGGVSGLVDHVKEKAKSVTNTAVENSMDIISSIPTSRVRSGSRRLSQSAMDTDVKLSFDQVLDHSVDFLVSHHHAIENGTFNWQQAFSGKTFNLPLSIPNLAQRNAISQADAPAAHNISFWGSFNYSDFADKDDTFSLDGKSFTYTLGVDSAISSSVMAGFSVATSNVNADYTAFNSAMEGDYSIDLTVATPYVSWSVNDSLNIWASLGYGHGRSDFSLNSIGDLDLASIAEVDPASRHQRRSDSFFSISSGIRWELSLSPKTDLALNLAASNASFLDVDISSARASAQLSRTFTRQWGSFLTAMDLALLMSNADKSVMELSGDFSVAPDTSRFTAFSSARVLLFGGDRKEWGMGGGLRYRPGPKGQGLSLSLQPSFGQQDNSLALFYKDGFPLNDDLELSLSSQPLTAQLQAELAYGFRTANGNALLTPYTDASLAHNSNTYSAGLRYELDSGLELDLSASHRQRSSGNNDNHLFLQLRSEL